MVILENFIRLAENVRAIFWFWVLSLSLMSWCIVDILMVMNPLFMTCFLFQAPTHGTDLSCVCTRELLISTVPQMWLSKLPQSQLNLVSRSRSPLQMLDFGLHFFFLHASLFCNLTSWLGICWVLCVRLMHFPFAVKIFEVDYCGRGNWLDQLALDRNYVKLLYSLMLILGKI